VYFIKVLGLAISFYTIDGILKGYITIYDIFVVVEVIVEDI
jgi:hypothetical protein